MASEGWFPLCFFSSLCCKSDTFPGGKSCSATVASSVSFSAAAGRYFETIRLDFNTIKFLDLDCLSQEGCHCSISFRYSILQSNSLSLFETELRSEVISLMLGRFQMMSNLLRYTMGLKFLDFNDILVS